MEVRVAGSIRLALGSYYSVNNVQSMVGKPIMQDGKQIGVIEKVDIENDFWWGVFEKENDNDNSMIINYAYVSMELKESED